MTYEPDATTHRICVEREELLRQHVELLREACANALSRLDDLEKHWLATIWDADAATLIRSALAATKPKEPTS